MDSVQVLVRTAIAENTGPYDVVRPGLFSRGRICASGTKEIPDSRVFRIFDVVCICLIDYEHITKDAHEIS